MAKPKRTTPTGGSEARTTIALNRRARFDYELGARFEAGLVLEGWELKSIRAGQAQLADSYVLVRDGQAWLLGARNRAAAERLDARGRRPDAQPQATASRQGDLSDLHGRADQGAGLRGHGAVLEGAARQVRSRVG